MAKIHVRSTRSSARSLPHPPATVWQALIGNAELGEQGAVLRCSAAGGPIAGAARITLYDSKRTLECWCDGQALRWDLEPRNGKTVVTFSHAGDASEMAPWLACLDILAAGAPLS